MKKKIKELNTEADVISLIGYETPMKFNFTSEGVFTFNTVVPDSNADGIVFYEVEFFSEPDVSPDFFAYDSFSNFLLKFKIASVNSIDESTQTKTQLYFRTYE
ncbi:hypothetical protein N9824_00495 [bacterium]|nr:hypothetical protein [bacterium]